MSYSTSNFTILTFALVAALASCSKPTNPSTEKTSPTTFASPSEAGAALLAAARSGDRSALLAIFGPGAAEVAFTGDTAQDKANLRGFVNAYSRMNRWEKMKAGGAILYIGVDNSAFPIPLGQNAAGRWYFDTAAGKDEIRARRIGKGELTGLEACKALANAQEQYFSQAHDGHPAGQYAQRLVSDPGKQNGLYWPPAAGQAESPLGRFADFAKALAVYPGDRPAFFNGYCYRVLPKPDDFTILAYPADYRESGIMSFMVGKNGVVYQKDLGERTEGLASALGAVKPADGWSPVEPSTGTAARTK